MKFLDYLIIPDAGKKYKKIRKQRAKQELHKRGVGEILIVKGSDSEEDILYLGKILKKGDRIGFDTFPLHFKEYKTIIEKAVRQGKFPRGIKIENIKTQQSFKQEIYGILGLEEEKLMRNKVDYLKNRNRFFQGLKRFVKKMLG